ncbi:MAG: methyltransferase domain-containing protein [Acidobacteria bacterium]|nr:methyltransferase domain-containing protein [Acidobacteriota bacterium]
MSSQTGERQTLEDFAQTMKRDWNQRALENARWFINTVKLDQSEDEFDATGESEIRSLILPELALMTGGRDPKSLRFLEIGCGIGRMTKHLAAIFGEVHSTDVSGAMIEQARERLNGLPNVHLHETSGVDFAALPGDYFDIAFSAFVFQHVPSKDVIRSNIREAYRVVKPGGVLKLHTNGVEAASYAEKEKDTWAGATFTESEVRSLARELGAQLISVYGAGTIYCWTTMRKPSAGSNARRAMAEPKIEFHARSDDATIKTIPTGGDNAWLSLIVTGLDREVVDANNLKVIINDRTVTPRYAGSVRPHFEAELGKRFGSSLDHLTYVEVGVPAGIAGGTAWAQIRLDSGEASQPFDFPTKEAKPAPIIVTVRNGADYGTDIHTRGPKSSLRLFVEGLDETANCDNVRVKAGERIIIPTFAGFVTDIAGYRVDAELPEGIEPGRTTLSLLFNSVISEAVPVEIAAVED